MVPVLVQLNPEFALGNKNLLDAGLEIVVLFVQLEMFYSTNWNY